MAIMSKLCVAAALCASAASAMPLSALLQGGAASTSVRSVKDLAAMARRHAQMLGTASGGPADIHNGTVTVVEAADPLTCSTVNHKWSVPAEKCLPNGKGGSGLYSCGVDAVLALGVTAFPAGNGCVGGTELFNTAAVCQACQSMGGNATFSKIDCAKTSTQQGARVSVCSNDKCDKDCVVKTGGYLGKCVPGIDAAAPDFLLREITAAGFVAWVEWPESTTCTGKYNVLLNIVNTCENGYLTSCDNKLGH